MIEAIFDEHYERIKGDLVQRGLTYDRLIDDLLDHVCCMVEEKMNDGTEFETSYEQVLDAIGLKRLTEIQHQTLLNLDIKHQRMKNFTYVFGLSSAVLTIVGSFFKSMHWPGAGILLTVGIVLITFVFLPLYFMTSYRELPEKKNPVYPIVGYITLAMLLLGSLFKIMHWPGAGIVLLTGSGFLIVGFVPLYVVNAFQRGGKGRVNLPYIIMLLVGVALVMLYSNIRMTRYAIDAYVEGSVSNEASVAEIMSVNEKLIENKLDSAQQSIRMDVRMIHAMASNLQVMIAEMKEGLIAYVDQAGVPIPEVKDKDNRWAGREAIVEHGNGRAFALEAKKYREALFNLVKDPVAQSQIEDHLKFTGLVSSHEYNESHVVNDPMVKNYYKLTDASKGIALAEYVAISYLMHP